MPDTKELIMLYRQGLQIDRRDVPFYSSPGEVKKLYVKAEIGYYVVYESPLDRIYPAPYSRPVFPGEKRIDLEARPVIVNFEESEYEEVLEDSVPLLHSNEIGDTIGEVKKVSNVQWLSENGS